MLTVDWTKTAAYQKDHNTKLGEIYGHYMMFCAVGPEITDGNAALFYARCKVHFDLVGCIWRYPGREYEPNVEDIISIIGLKANVHTEPFKTWALRHVKVSNEKYMERYEREVNNGEPNICNCTAS